MTSMPPDSANPHRRREPSLSPPPYVLNRHGGRVLDPENAVRLKGQGPVRATVYVGATLLIRKTVWDNDRQLRADLSEAADRADLALGEVSYDTDLARLGSDSDEGGGGSVGDFTGDVPARGDSTDLGNESSGDESIGTEPTGGEAMGTESTGGEAMGTESTGGEAMGTESTGGESTGPAGPDSDSSGDVDGSATADSGGDGAPQQARSISQLIEDLLVVRVEIVPKDESLANVPPDAWRVLQNYRSLVRGRDDERYRVDLVTLEHLMQATAGISGTGYMGTGYMGTGYMGTGYMGTGYMGTAAPSAEYAVPGRGGRAPVSWLGPQPTRCKDDALQTRRPVVAVVDTGAGVHDWLPDTIVDREPRVGSLLIGLPDGPYNSEVHGSVNDPLEGVLDNHAGHGTFIAGLIRQTCPDANVLAVRVMYGDGAVAEFDLLTALNRLVVRQALALKTQSRERAFDVLLLSLGYYHELPADQAMDHRLLAPLSELGRMGVVTVAAAGNDSTDRHFYPAAFAPHPHSRFPSEHNCSPVVSVGALNPDRASVAMFSNDGNWVSTHRIGAALVSTMPRLNGSAMPVARFRTVRGQLRATLDPDDYCSGFGLWSGTSFSAPLLAGEIAEHALAGGRLDILTVESAADRCWDALATLVPGLIRP